MKRLPPSLLALFFAALCAPAAHAQAPQKPAEPQQPDAKPAAEAEKPRPAPGQPADPEILGKIFACLNDGLPKDWKKTWFTVKETGSEDEDRKRHFKADFFFATDLKDSKGKKLSPCGGEPVIEGVKALNDYLPASQQGWTGATFTFTREGGNAGSDLRLFYARPRRARQAGDQAAPPRKAARKADQAPSSKAGSFRKSWSGREDLNLRPPAPHPWSCNGAFYQSTPCNTRLPHLTAMKAMTGTASEQTEATFA